MKKQGPTVLINSTPLHERDYISSMLDTLRYAYKIINKGDDMQKKGKKEKIFAVPPSPAAFFPPPGVTTVAVDCHNKNEERTMEGILNAENNRREKAAAREERKARGYSFKVFDEQVIDLFEISTTLDRKYPIAFVV